MEILDGVEQSLDPLIAILTGAPKELCEDVLPCLITEEVCIACEHHRWRGPGHAHTLLMGGLVLELILVVPFP